MEKKKIYKTYNINGIKVEFPVTMGVTDLANIIVTLVKALDGVKFTKDITKKKHGNK